MHLIIAREAALELEIAERTAELAELRHVRESLEPAARAIEPERFRRYGLDLLEEYVAPMTLRRAQGGGARDARCAP